MPSKRTVVLRWLQAIWPWLVLVLFLHVVSPVEPGPAEWSLRECQGFFVAALGLMELGYLCRSLSLCREIPKTAGRKVRRRPSLAIVVLGIAGYVPRILLLAVSYDWLWTFESLGFLAQVDWRMAIGLGIVLEPVFRIALERAYRVLRACLPSSDPRYRAFWSRVPRGVAASWLSAADTTVISPLIEETICRGIFVFYVSSLLGTWPAIALGWGLCTAAHLYQGLERILSVTMFYAVVVGLLFSPLGLMAACAFHITCNLRFSENLYEWTRWRIATEVRLCGGA